MTTLPRALAPLRHPRYRRLACSLGLSLLSQGMWAVAVVWQVLEAERGDPFRQLRRQRTVGRAQVRRSGGQRALCRSSIPTNFILNPSSLMPGPALRPWALGLGPRIGEHYGA